MKSLPEVNKAIVAWHYEKGIIDGATDQTQCLKMHEEFVELFCACHPDLTMSQLFRLFNANTARLYDKGKFAPITEENSLEEKIDAVGDMYVVGMNILERNETTLQKCLNGVFSIISKRKKGKVIDGSFVKENSNV